MNYLVYLQSTVDSMYIFFRFKPNVYLNNNATRKRTCWPKSTFCYCLILFKRIIRWQKLSIWKLRATEMHLIVFLKLLGWHMRPDFLANTSCRFTHALWSIYSRRWSITLIFPLLVYCLDIALIHQTGNTQKYLQVVTIKIYIYMCNTKTHLCTTGRFNWRQCSFPIQNSGVFFKNYYHLFICF